MRSQKVSHDCLTHTMGVEIYAYPEPWTHYIPGGNQYGFGEEYRTFQWQFVSSPKTRKQNFVYICLSKQTLHKDYRQNIAWCFIAKIIWNLIGLKLEKNPPLWVSFQWPFPPLFSAKVLEKYHSLQENFNEKESASHLKLWDKRFLRKNTQHQHIETVGEMEWLG